MSPVSIDRFITQLEAITIDKIAVNKGKVNEKIIEAILHDRLYQRTVVEVALNECTIKTADGEITGLHPTLIEAQSTSQAERIYQLLLQQNALSPLLKSRIAVVSSRHGFERNRSILKKWQSGEIDFVIAIDMLYESIDVPRLTHIIKRPTRSIIRGDQATGRGLRNDPDNPDKVLRVLEIFHTARAEAAGYRTVPQLLKLVDYNPGMIYSHRNIRKSSKTQGSIKRRPEITLSTQVTGQTYIKLKDEIKVGRDDYDFQSPEEARTYWVEYLKTKYQEIADHYNQTGDYKIVIDINRRGKDVGDSFLIKSNFESQFGMRCAISLYNIYSQEELIEIIGNIENSQNLPSIWRVLRSPKALFQFYIENWQQGYQGNPQNLLAEKFSVSSETFNKIINRWIDQGFLPKEIHSHGISRYELSGYYFKLIQYLNELKTDSIIGSKFEVLYLERFPSVLSIISQVESNLLQILTERFIHDGEAGSVTPKTISDYVLQNKLQLHDNWGKVVTELSNLLAPFENVIGSDNFILSLAKQGINKNTQIIVVTLTEFIKKEHPQIYNEALVETFVEQEVVDKNLLAIPETDEPDKKVDASVMKIQTLEAINLDKRVPDQIASDQLSTDITTDKLEIKNQPRQQIMPELIFEDGTDLVSLESTRLKKLLRSSRMTKQQRDLYNYILGLTDGQKHTAEEALSHFNIKPGVLRRSLTLGLVKINKCQNKPAPVTVVTQEFERFMKLSPEERQFVLNHLTEKQRQPFVRRFNLDGFYGDNPQIIEVDRVAKDIGRDEMAINSLIFNARRRMYKLINTGELRAARKDPIQSLNNGIELDALPKTELLCFLKLAGFSDQISIIFVDFYTTNHLKQYPTYGELAEKYILTTPQISGIIRKVRARLNRYVVENELTPDNLIKYLDQHQNTPEVISSRIFGLGSKYRLPTPIQELLKYSDEEKKKTLRLLPWMQRWVIIERFNLLNRDGKGAHKVDYEILIKKSGWKANKIIQSQHNGLAYLTGLFEGKPRIDRQHTSDQMFELSGEIRVDDLSEETFRRLCDKAGVDAFKQDLFIYRMNIGADNPMVRSLEETAAFFSVATGTVSDNMKATRKKLIQLVEQNGLNNDNLEINQTSVNKDKESFKIGENIYLDEISPEVREWMFTRAKLNPYQRNALITRLGLNNTYEIRTWNEVEEILGLPVELVKGHGNQAMNKLHSFIKENNMSIEMINQRSLRNS